MPCLFFALPQHFDGGAELYKDFTYILVFCAGCFCYNGGNSPRSREEGTPWQNVKHLSPGLRWLSG